MASEIEALNNPKYDVLDNIIEMIHVRAVKMAKDEKKALVRRFDKVINIFISKMRALDHTFNQIFKKIGFTGSFYDYLRVREATEFDLNIILKPKFKMEPQKKKCRAGYTYIHVIDDFGCETSIKNWIVDGLLNANRVKQWLEGVVARTLDSTNRKIDDCEITFAKSGPAMTIKISSASPPVKNISIDLVPVIEFPYSQWPHIPRKANKLLNGSDKEPWFAVPKGEESWRLSFPIQEQYMIKDLHYFKYTLKLLKKVRDEFQINKVASYYIKTLFLWELDKNRDRNIWVKNRRGCLFIHMLIRLREALREGRLPFYWDENCNLIGNFKREYLENSYGKINNFIQQINKLIEDKAALTNYIGMKLNSATTS